MKIETIRIQNGSNVQELSLSTDGAKNLNFVIGMNDSGKTRTFNEIKSHFFKQNTESIIKIKLKDGGLQNPDLVFVGENPWRDHAWPVHKRLFDKKEFSDDELLTIIARANQMLSKIGGVFENIDNLLQLQNKKILVNKGFAMGPNIIVNYALFIAIRDIIEPNLPMIIDGGYLGYFSDDFYLKTIRMLGENVNQLLIFCTDTIFSPSHKSMLDDRIFPSVHEFLKEKKMLGTVYNLQQNNPEKGWQFPNIEQIA